MPRGHICPEYLDGPVDRPLETIYSDLDEFTMELLPDEPDLRDRLDVMFALPPLHYEGVFLKGLLFTQGADSLIEQFPWVQELFQVGAYSMCTSYPWSSKADYLMVCYDNQARHEAFRKKNPERADKPLIGLQDSDFLNEYIIAPQPVEKKVIDVLCIGRLQRIKNIAIFVEAIKIYHQKYGAIKTVLIAGQDFDMNYCGLDQEGMDQIRKIQKLLVHPQDYLEIIPKVPYYDLPRLYSMSKVYTLASYIEGKNRTLAEAMSCNVPVVCFEHFNTYARGDQSPFPAKAGLTAPLGPEGLADTLHQALNQRENFTPRKSFLRESGRRNVLRRLISELPYFRERLASDRDERELWLDLAVQANHQMSLSQFLYDDIKACKAWSQGTENVANSLNEYRTKFVASELTQE